METPLISIIIPVYNVRPYLDACFNSLKKQNYPKLEFIIIDDGSTDGSGIFCDNFAKLDPRAKVFHQENRGLSGARNCGLREAKGEYITFLDADDALAPDCIQYLFALISKYKTKMSICAIKEITAKNHKKDYGASYIEEPLNTAEALNRMLLEKGFNVSAYAKMYHKNLWQGITFPEGLLHEDLGTTYKLIKKCPQIAYGPKAKYIYKKRGNSISSNGFNMQKLSIIALTDQMCDNLEPDFPYLLNTIRLRRVHARFSVLRQILQVNNPSAEVEKATQEIINYIKSHQKYITKNPVAGKRDKLALRALLLGKNIFKFTWQAYEFFRG